MIRFARFSNCRVAIHIGCCMHPQSFHHRIPAPPLGLLEGSCQPLTANSCPSRLTVTRSIDQLTQACFLAAKQVKEPGANAQGATAVTGSKVPL